MKHSMLLSGLSGLALCQQPLHAQTYIQPPEVTMVDKNGIDLLSGSATLSVKRGSIGSGMGELSYTDYWVSSLVSNNLNNTLQFNLNQRTEVYGASAGFENSSKSFKQQSANSTTWLHLNYVDGILTQSADGNTMWVTMKDGEVRTYIFPTGLTFMILSTRVQPNGVIWTYTWQMSNGYARPLTLTNNLGYQISLTYQSNTTPNYTDQVNVFNWGFVSSVSFYNLAKSLSPIFSAIGSSASGGQGGTAQVVTAGGQVWTTTGSTAASSLQPTATSPFTVKTPSSSTANFSYIPVAPQPVNQPLSTSATVNGVTYNYKFNLSGVNTANNGDTLATDPLGNVTEVIYNNGQSYFASSSWPTSVKDPLSNTTTYTGSGYIVTNVTRPGLDQDIYAYDAYNDITSVTHVQKPGSSPSNANIVQSAIFASVCTSMICMKPTSTTDANNNTTQYTYDPTHGGVLTETLPAVAVPGVSGTINPVKRYSYVQRSAWILNGSGGYVKAATPVWLPNDERTCRITATVSGACAGGSADEVVTTYQYGPDSGPNNLLLRGMTVSSNGQSLLTCYAYDATGNKISETKPLGTGALGGTCP